MNDDQQRYLQKDLPYELDACERAYLVLTSDELARFRQSQAEINMFVESFWMHARNLSEFFESGQGGSTASPLDFTDEQYVKPESLRSVRTIINAQVTHMQYGRSEEEKRQLAFRIQTVFGAISKAARQFEERLTKGSLRFWRQRTPMSIDDVVASFSTPVSVLQPATSTSHTLEFGVNYFPITGPTNHGKN